MTENKGNNEKKGLTNFVAYSFDPGTVNFSVAKVSVNLDPSNKKKYFGISLDWFEMLLLKYPSQEDYKRKTNERREKDIIEAYYRELNHGKLKKIQDEIEERLKNDPTYKINIVAEPQMDVVNTCGYKVPIMYALYTATHMFFLTRYGSDKVRFIPWSGKNKSGLDGKHGDARKTLTIDVAYDALKRDGFDDMAERLMELKRPKPAQDVADAYNQGRSFIISVITSPLPSLGYTVITDTNESKNVSRQRTALKHTGQEKELDDIKKVKKAKKTKKDVIQPKASKSKKSEVREKAKDKNNHDEESTVKKPVRKRKSNQKKIKDSKNEREEEGDNAPEVEIVKKKTRKRKAEDVDSVDNSSTSRPSKKIKTEELDLFNLYMDDIALSPIKENTEEVDDDQALL